MAPAVSDPMPADLVPAAQGTAPLRLGVFADAMRQQAWVTRAVARISSDPAVDVVALVLSATPLARVSAGGLLFRQYCRLDRCWSALQPDPFAPTDLADALARVEPLCLDAEDPGAHDALASLHLDLVLDLGHPLAGPAAAGARLGALSATRGHRLDAAAVVGEVLGGTPSLCSQIALTPESGVEHVVMRSWSRTDLLSLHRTAGRHAWKTSLLLSRCIGNLAHGAGVSSEADGVAVRGGTPHEIASAEASEAAPLAPGPPSSARMLRFLPRQLSRLLVQGRRVHLTRRAWFVAYQLNPDHPIPDDLSGFRELQSPRDRFWADPFPVVTGDTCHIFVEEWPYGLGRGRIAVLEMGRTGSWRRLGTALERDYHLSYPFVFPWRDGYYMIPESSAGGVVELFRATGYPLEWEPVTTLLEDDGAVDATLIERDGSWWMFVNRGAEGVSRHDELHLYRAESPLGPWLPHPHNPVVSDVRTARPAGRPIEWGGELYRPAQDCAHRYGHAVEVRRVTELTAESYREEPHLRLDPAALAGANRTHTLNTDDWITVVDGHRDQWHLG